MPELEKYLNEIDSCNGSSGNIKKCMMFGSEKFRKFMLQIIEEFLLERLLLWRDYKAATLCSNIRANVCVLRLLYISSTACEPIGSGKSGLSPMMHNDLSRYLINV